MERENLIIVANLGRCVTVRAADESPDSPNYVYHGGNCVAGPLHWREATAYAMDLLSKRRRVEGVDYARESQRTRYTKAGTQRCRQLGPMSVPTTALGDIFEGKK